MNSADFSDPTSTTQDRRFVIGTAGHVDHGKSTLVRALTDIDPDRLAEEQAREMTIDLGFAWFTLPSGREVSVIDVPGHERFVRNMLAGVGGVDVAMLVIAADDGPMPQTREHLAILDLLGVSHGVVALSRTDLVDEEWLELVSEEIRELLGTTSLAAAPVVPVSAITGEGIDELATALDLQLDHANPRDANGRPRLPVDRSFKVSGFGTVVTGTLIDGEIRLGQELMLYPAGHGVRVRGLQEHQTKVESASAGSRVAINLGGVDVDQVQRGDVLALAGSLTPSLRLDCRMRLLPDAPAELEQNDEVIVFTGSLETPARVTLLDTDAVAPGQEALAQLRLAAPVVALRGDRMILRRPSPATTIGGGMIIDPAPERHKRFQEDVIHHLEVLAEGTPEDLVRQALGDEVLDAGSLAKRANVPDVLSLLPTMVEQGDVVALGHPEGRAIDLRSSVVRAATFDRIATKLEALLWEHHEALPLSPGIRRDDVRASLGVTAQRAFDALMREFESRGIVRSDGAVVTAPGFEVRLSDSQRATADRFLNLAREAPFAPPSPDDAGLERDLVGALAARGEVERVSAQIVYPSDVFATIRDRVREKLDQDGEITLAEYRDMFDTSRKYAQPTLEHLDELRVTRRKGDVRVKFVGPGAGS